MQRSNTTPSNSRSGSMRRASPLSVGWISTDAICAVLRHVVIASVSSAVLVPGRYHVGVAQPANSADANSRAMRDFITIVLSFERRCAGHRDIDKHVAVE